MSAFVLEDGIVYHTYSTYARGAGRPLGHVCVARPCPQGPQRDGHVVEPPRRIRYALSDGVALLCDRSPQASSTGSGG